MFYSSLRAPCSPPCRSCHPFSLDSLSPLISRVGLLCPSASLRTFPLFLWLPRCPTLVICALSHTRSICLLLGFSTLLAAHLRLWGPPLSSLPFSGRHYPGSYFSPFSPPLQFFLPPAFSLRFSQPSLGPLIVSQLFTLPTAIVTARLVALCSSFPTLCASSLLLLTYFRLPFCALVLHLFLLLLNCFFSVCLICFHISASLLRFFRILPPLPLFSFLRIAIMSSSRRPRHNRDLTIRIAVASGLHTRSVINHPHHFEAALGCSGLPALRPPSFTFPCLRDVLP